MQLIIPTLFFQPTINYLSVDQKLLFLANLFYHFDRDVEFEEVGYENSVHFLDLNWLLINYHHSFKQYQEVHYPA